MNPRSVTLSTVGLTTGYRGRRGENVVVTHGLDATLHSGELTCLLGPNGAGKSTLLRTLSGFIPPLEGEVLIAGKPLGSYAPAELARMVGVVLTERLMVANMTVEELVSMGRSPYTGFWGRLSGRDRAKVAEAMDLVRVTPLRHRMIQTLSDGERQKVMIAKALAQDTPVIFLDEPTAFLDYPSKVEIMQFLLRLTREKGMTVFLSIHDLELALRMADKVWLLDRGKGVAVGTPEDLSLAGEPGRFFEREGVRFVPEEGLFEILRPMTRTIRLTGEGVRFAMARKALGRCGIDASPSASPAGGTVEVTPRAFIFNGREVATIEALLSLVNQDNELNDI